MLLRRVSIMAAAIASLSISTLQPILIPQVVAQPTSSPSPRQQSSESGWLKDLNLTQDQLRQIKAIRKQSKDQITQKRQAMRQAQQELEALMASGASKDEVRNKYNQLKTLRQQLTDANFENTLAIREILNVEQRQKFAAYMYKR